MVLILVHTWFPHAVSADVGKAYLEVMKKYPEDRSLSKPVLTVAVKATKDGFKGLSIDDIKDGKIKQTITVILLPIALHLRWRTTLQIPLLWTVRAILPSKSATRGRTCHGRQWIRIQTRVHCLRGQDK